MSADTGGRTGRRPGRTDTRAALLEAARSQFSVHGYEKATLRAIAAEAGVDPGLIRHFFGDKESLFAETVEFPPRFTDAVDRALAQGLDGLGERFTRAYLALWEDEVSGPALRALARTAVTHDRALERLRALLVPRLARRIRGVLGEEDAELRLALAASSLLGVALARHVLRIPPFADMDLEAVVAAVAPRVQACFSEPAGRPPDEGVGG